MTVASAAADLDLPRLDELVALLGRDRVHGLAALYVTELRAAPGTLRALVDDGDGADLPAAMHRLRGAALNLGCNRVADGAELLARGAPHDVSRQLAAFQHDCRCAADALVEYFDAAVEL